MSTESKSSTKNPSREELCDTTSVFVRPSPAIVISNQRFHGSEGQFSGYAEQLVLEISYNKDGRPMPQRANIYRLSMEQPVSSAAKTRLHQEKVEGDA